MIARYQKQVLIFKILDPQLISGGDHNLVRSLFNAHFLAWSGRRSTDSMLNLLIVCRPGAIAYFFFAGLFLAAAGFRPSPIFLAVSARLAL